MPTALYVDRQQFKSITPKVGRPEKSMHIMKITKEIIRVY